MKFADNLKHLCKLKNTTPTGLCRELGLSISKVSAWYNGALPKEKVMSQLAEKLNCSVADFFADDNSEMAEATNDDEHDILRIYRALSRKEKHEFMAMTYRFEECESN